ELEIEIDGIIVAPMVKAQREMMIGARWDANFGAVVVVGDGGKYVEAMPDVATMLYPFDVEYVLEELKALRMAPLFEGVRGESALPLEKIAWMAAQLGEWLHNNQGKVASVDINPLMVGPLQQAIAVDALVELRQ